MAFFIVNEEFYFAKKLESLQNDEAYKAEWTGKTVVDLKAFFEVNGLTAQQHFDEFGWAEQLSANAEFDVAAYFAAKAKQTGLTVEEVIQAFKDNGLTVATHYEKYGKAEIEAGELDFTPGATAPSTLTEALANLKAAKDAVAEFNEDLEDIAGAGVTAESYANGAATKVKDVLTAAATAVAAVVTADSTAKFTKVLTPGDYDAGSAAVQAALLSDAKAVLSQALTAAEGIVAALSKEAAEEGLTKLFAQIESATKSVATTEAAYGAADVVLAGKIAEYNTANSPSTALTAAGYAATVDSSTGDVTRASITSLHFNTSKNAYEFYTDATMPSPAPSFVITKSDTGAQALLDAVNAVYAAANKQGNSIEALATLKASAAYTSDAEALFDDIAEAKLLVSNPESVDAEGEIVSGATLGIKEAIAVLDAAVASQAEAEALVQTEEELLAAVEAAEQAFEDAGLELPVELDDGLTSVATAGDDIFIFGDIDTATINSFGLLGTDSLYIGTSFALNTGALKDGDPSVLEVFFIQNGNDTIVTLETATYSSNESGVDEISITLSGVKAADLTLTEDGFVTLA